MIQFKLPVWVYNSEGVATDVLELSLVEFAKLKEENRTALESLDHF